MSARASRRGWLALAVFLTAFALFEAVKHRGWTIPAAAAGAALPFLAFTAPLAAVLRHPLPPLCVLVAVMFVPQPSAAAIAEFTGALAWLAHIAYRRARPASAPDPRPLPS